MRAFHDFDFLEVKALSEEGGSYVLTGMATTNTPDRTEDVVEPNACAFAPIIPLLMNHDTRKPVGKAMLGRPTSKGIPFTAKIPVITKPGKLKEMVDMAIESIQLGLIKCVSIGFRVLSGGAERLPSGGKRFTNIEILELSLCAIGMQPEAVIDSISGSKSKVNAGRGAIYLDKVKREPVQLIKARKPVKLKKVRTPGSPIELIQAQRPVKTGRGPIQLVSATD